MPAISGFMIVKNVIRQGYPFAEAIASALPICDEFLISDGYSDDGTFEMLQKISSLNKKVKLSRIEWEKKDLTVLADISNKLRKVLIRLLVLCSGSKISFLTLAFLKIE